MISFGGKLYPRAKLEELVAKDKGYSIDPFGMVDSAYEAIFGK